MTGLPDPLPCTGRCVVLRRLRSDDLRAFQAYRHDPDVGRLQGWEPMPDDEAAEFLESMNRAAPLVPGEWFQIGIAERDSDRLIGDLGVHVQADQETAEVGFSLRTESQGRGLASEALSLLVGLLFSRTEIGAVHATTDQRNKRAIRLLERLGMTPILTRETEFRGLPCTEITYSLSRPAGKG